MFSKNKSDKTGANAVKPAVPSIISQDLTIRGDLISDGEIQIDGNVHGDIHTSTLLVGETAEVNGEIKAKRVRVYGRVNGQITAQSVTLANTAHVAGDVVHEDLSIEKGAFLEGHCQRIVEQRVESIARGNRNDTDAASPAGGKVREVTPPVPTKPHTAAQQDGAPALKKMDKPANGSGKAASA